MRVFKHRSFHQWAVSEGLTDAILKKAIREMNQGLFEACLGSGLYKKRIAMPGKGKKDGYRMLVAFRVNDKAIFCHGFAKNIRADISEKEQKAYRQLAKDYLNLDAITIKSMLETSKLYEVM